MNKSSFEKHFNVAFSVFVFFLSRMKLLQKKIMWKWRKLQVFLRPEKQAKEQPSKILFAQEKYLMDP